MHAGFKQLLTIRDGEPVDAVTRHHVDNCAACRERLAGLTGVRDALRALPALTPPVDGWTRVAAKLDRAPSSTRWWPAAVAAAAALVVAVLWAGSETAVRQPAPVLSDASPAALTGDGVAGEEAGLDGLVQESRRLERLLRELETATPRVMNTGTAGTIAGLQDGIAVIDYGLSRDGGLSATQSEQLWQRRVDLMNTLVQVRGAQVQQIASLGR